MIKFIRVFVLSLSLGALLCYVGSASAESSSVVGGSASVRLDFAIDIPSVLFLQVGTAGATIDTVTFGVTDVPGTGAVAGTSSGANPVPVQVSGLVGAGATITLTADSLTPLADGANNIPFDEIRDLVIESALIPSLMIMILIIRLACTLEVLLIL